MDNAKFYILTLIFIIGTTQRLSPVPVSGDAVNKGSPFKTERRSDNRLLKRYYVQQPLYETETDHGAYTLQHIGQPIENQFYIRPHNKVAFTQNEEYKINSFKEEKPLDFGKEKITSVPYKAQPYKFIYAEPFRSHRQTLEFDEESHKLLSTPQTITLQTQSFPELSHQLQTYYDHHENEEYAVNYKFGYRVNDPHTGVEFGHSEVAEGKTKKGHYHVLLPDGRVQNVKYWTDPSGYHATVTYEGQALHPIYH